MDPLYAELLGRAVAIFRRSLANTPLAREWLAGKGVTNAALLDRISVGWSDGSLASMARGEVAERLRTLGLVDAEGRERFSGSVVIPVFDEKGAVVQIAGYAEDGALRWLLPEETPTFWNAACLKSARDVLVVPDPLAGLVEVAGGLEGVIAPGGPGKPLGQCAKDLLAAHAPRVTLKGCDWLRPELEALGIQVEGRKTVTHDQVVEQDANGFTVEFPRRLRFVVQGIAHDSPRHLRASIKAFRRPADGVEARPRIHLDTMDLFHARSRIGFAKTAACLLGEDPTLMEDLLGKVVSLAEEFLAGRDRQVPTVVVSESEKAEALEFLRDPKLLDRVVADLGALGYVGEEANKKVAWLASVSRKVEDPLSILVVSRSAAGKSTLAEAVAALAPVEDVLRFTRLTAQTLYYQKPDALAHKLVLVEEAEGVEDAAYALRILQSARKLSLSTAAGKGDARTREVKGPVSLFVTTTRTDLNEETAGRFLTLSVDESREQTRAILAAQREAEARLPGERERLIRLHQNAQRLLEPVQIVNPYAPYLTFPDERLSARRDHRKYLGLIRAVAFVYQKQRKVVAGAVEVTLDDIRIGNALAHHALGQSLFDLTPPSRRLLMELRDWLSAKARSEGAELAQVQFSQRELREHVGWRKSQLAEHLKEILDAEYLLAITGGSQGRRTLYRLDWDGKGLDGERFCSHLAAVEQLSGHLPGASREGAGKRKSGKLPGGPPGSAGSGGTSRVSGGRDGR